MGPIDRIERRLKLHDVRVLMSVVEAGSMAKAAQRLGTSQPAISRSIADLEHTLGAAPGASRRRNTARPSSGAASRFSTSCARA